MAEVGYFLSSEEHDARFLVDTARQAEASGFRSVWISDHFHPWSDAQGQSPFVWSVIGGIAATTELTVTTAVTCPTFRIHPAILAQAAATSASMLPGRFQFGVGSGESLNEHVLGQHWPPADIRLERLREAVELIRQLWTGAITTHHGTHFTVENARIYTLPDEPPPILVSGFGPKAADLAAEIGDGYMNTKPDAELVQRYRTKGGKGPTQAGIKLCWAEDEASARKTAFELWAQAGVPGELNQELPMPAHFEQAAQNVTEDQVAEAITCGPDPDAHAKAIQKYFEAGFDQVFVSQVGDDQMGFFRFFEREVRPRLDL
jgi:G6PDH family F420-dependent oxidoreductase